MVAVDGVLVQTLGVLEGVRKRVTIIVQLISRCVKDSSIIWSHQISILQAVELVELATTLSHTGVLAAHVGIEATQDRFVGIWVRLTSGRIKIQLIGFQIGHTIAIRVGVMLAVEDGQVAKVLQLPDVVYAILVNIDKLGFLGLFLWSYDGGSAIETRGVSPVGRPVAGIGQVAVSAEQILGRHHEVGAKFHILFCDSLFVIDLGNRQFGPGDGDGLFVLQGQSSLKSLLSGDECRLGVGDLLCGLGGGIIGDFATTRQICIIEAIVGNQAFLIALERGFHVRLEIGDGTDNVPEAQFVNAAVEAHASAGVNHGGTMADWHAGGVVAIIQQAIDEQAHRILGVIVGDGQVSPGIGLQRGRTN